MKTLKVTNTYKYYKKPYQDGRYIGVRNWKYLRDQMEENHPHEDTEYINSETHRAYGFIYGTKREISYILEN